MTNSFITVIADAKTFEEACLYLTKVREQLGVRYRQPTSREIFEVYLHTQPMLGARLGLRQQGFELPSSKVLLSEALGIDTGNFSAVLHMYRRAEIFLDPIAIELVSDVDKGIRSIHSARNLYKRRLAGSVSNSAEQRTLITGALANLSGIIKALTGLGPIHPRIDPTDLVSWAQEAVGYRSQITTLINHLKKAAARNES